jgi:sporulation protein YlmC with PRC-barrel domain
MTSRQMFTSRLRGRPLLDSEGLTIGRIRDVVILPSAVNDPPRALGLVVTLQRRRIFVNLGQVTEISVDGAHLLGGAVELDRFTRRTGEMLASELYGRQTEDGNIVDVAISPSEYQRVGWEVSALAVSHRMSLPRRGQEIVPWDRHPELFKTDPPAEQLTELRELRPADLATTVEELPPSRRSQIAAALDDEKVATGRPVRRLSRRACRIPRRPA